MKKNVAIMLAVIVLLSFGALTACNEQASVVKITLYTTSDSIPRVVKHTIGEDDLPQVTNGNLTFDGWYYDEEFNKQFKYTDDIAEGTALYAKWTQGGSQTTNKVVLTLNLNYEGSTSSTYELNKNETFTLPSVTRTGYDFAGWFTQAVDGIQWTNSMPVSVDTTLYAHWTKTGGGNTPTPTPVDLSAALSKYGDTSSWNFAVATTIVDEKGEYGYYYEYFGDYIKDEYEDEQGNSCADYFDMSDYYVWYYYCADSNGNYAKYADTTDEFSEAYSYSVIVDLSTISAYTFTQSGDGYAAQNPSGAGNAILGEYTGYTWNSFTIYISNNEITKIVAVLSDGSTYTYEFSKYGQISFTLPNATEGGASGGEGDPLPTEPTGVMDNQVYDESTFDNKNLQQKMEDSDDTIGLPSAGTYNALVIPVQFKGDTITQTQLNNLNVAFNGTSVQTGWESVASYYKKSSYGKLNLTFDIMDPYQANNNAAYYKNYNQPFDIDGQTWEKDGSALILEEVLAYYESLIDLTKYDTNGDGCIDAVYLIYSESVDYVDADFYWAYVTWYYGENQYDGLDAYYYLFAGFDFMDEDVDKKGISVNAETYIHETGHLLGLDDYYDYDTNSGGNQGLGGADMMDYNVGDHGVYSKIMLGWIDPTIVTSTQTVTIKSSQEGGYAILIPLNWNNSYFCEYLLIDLYTATGLNELGASQQDTILYDGAEYGVRIYHVSSWAKDPYNNSFGSFTDNNNSISNIPLIKLVEADGETSSSKSGSWASESDLWQEGDTFSGVFPQYMRNDGKTLNFDIAIDSVSAESATVTITYNTAA